MDLAHEIGERDFGGGNEPEILLHGRPLDQSRSTSDSQIEFRLANLLPIRQGISERIA